MWQDYVIAIAQWMFVLALIPTLLHKEEKPAFISSALIALLLAVLGITYLSLELFISTIPAWIQSIMWAWIGVQRFRINRKKNIPVIEMPSFFKKKR